MKKNSFIQSLYQLSHDTDNALIAQAASKIEEMYDALSELTEETTCNYNHDGYCQEHYLQPNPCPVSVSQKLLAELDVDN